MEGPAHISRFMRRDGRSSRRQAFAHLILHVVSVVLESPIAAHACSVISDSVTPWPIAHQVLLSMEFSRQEYCSGLPFPPPRNLPTAAILCKKLPPVTSQH